MAPDATIALDFALARLAGIIDKLLVYPDAMRANMERTGGLVFSQRVLLALTQGGMSREKAYALVQAHAMDVWHSNGKKQFADLLKKDPAVTKTLDKKTLAGLFDYGSYGRHVDTIFRRVFA